MTLEDEEGVANVIVWKKTFARFRSIVLGARLVRVHGRLQSAKGVIHVVAERMEDLSDRLGDLLKGRSEEHTSELQSLMRISYAVFCLKKKKHKNKTQNS